MRHETPQADRFSRTIRLHREHVRWILADWQRLSAATLAKHNANVRDEMPIAKALFETLLDGDSHSTFLAITHTLCGWYAVSEFCLTRKLLAPIGQQIEDSIHDTTPAAGGG